MLSLARCAVLLTKADLSDGEFTAIYAPLLRECQRAGECPYEWTAIRHLLALRFQQVRRTDDNAGTRERHGEERAGETGCERMSGR